MRRVVYSGPMQRLQERLWGPHTKWSPAAAANSGSVIWLLGVRYAIPAAGENGDNSQVEKALSEFLQDFSSRLWLTYRRGFEALGDSKVTTDVGWGCMLRSGQMLVAQALVCHSLGRSWRRDAQKPASQGYLEIVRSFGDSASCPFSIHNILNVGQAYGLTVGSWLGPYALCRALEALGHADTESFRTGQCKRTLPMAIYVVSGDAEGERGGAPVLFIDDAADLCSDWGGPSMDWAPLLVLVPLVLGLDKINPRYLPSLQAAFTFPQSLGILGGKPGASTYIVGIQEDQVLYLDPHDVQPAVKMTSPDVDTDTSSYHCGLVRRMALEAVDPSLALGFYCRDRMEFDDLCQRASDLATHSNGAPMFTVANGTGRWKQVDCVSLSMDSDEVGTDVEETISKKPNSDHADEDWQIL